MKGAILNMQSGNMTFYFPCFQKALIHHEDIFMSLELDSSQPSFKCPLILFKLNASL